MFALTSIAQVLTSSLKPTTLNDSQARKKCLCHTVMLPNKASLLSRPIITWYQKQHLSSSTSVRALRRFLPTQGGRKCQAGNKNRWELYCVSSSSKSQRYWTGLELTARLNRVNTVLYENFVAHHNVSYCVHWTRSEPGAFNHLLCAALHTEGEKAEMGFSLGNLSVRSLCQLGGKSGKIAIF